MESDWDAKWRAENILALHWSPGKLPVDPFAIAGELDITVEETRLALNLSGALIKEAGGAPLINIESSEPRVWRKYICACELGFFAQRQGDDAYHLHFVRSHAVAEDDLIGRFALEFAVNLLMPKQNVLDVHGQSPSLWEMARKFGVPPRLMRERLEELELAITE